MAAEALPLDTSLDDLGIDSHARINILFELEEELNIVTEIEVLESVTTLRELTAVIAPMLP